MLELRNKNGFASLTEVIMTSIIFTIASAGILTTISMISVQGGGSSHRLEAAYAAKAVMDELRSSVSRETWENNNPSSPLTPGTHTRVIGSYTVSYTVTNTNPADPKAPRQVTMQVNYPD